MYRYILPYSQYFVKSPYLSKIFLEHFFSLCPREESDLYLILRTDLFYPLNYRGFCSNAGNCRSAHITIIYISSLF